ncbi:ParB/RepB/Spo0J family partition protein [Pelotomaculum propionicicum]|uniref:Chromosome-partitioning protein Spo0J n=1 Tax=Pelotomaculum propionicicum TaxID=258475 RepID=A0A4Y7RXA2_9FIRM|nr:ParB/RepB/Spo0J family partition protein [Pelotomaculum propionicicum]TEB13390.1 Chromosome-partitioning protein Spo0J [Pelotomaculum propionicicum]
MSEYKEPPMLDPEDPQGCLYGIPGLHGGALYSVPMYMVEPNPNNPRKNFDREELEKLARSIREVGILQPLILIKQADHVFRIVAGERRYRAAQLAGIGSVPGIILQLTPEQEAEVMLIENLQRKDLDPIEEARAYQALLDGHGYTQEALGEKLGVSQAHIANRIRLLDLPETVQQNISRGIISPSAAKELLACKKAADEGLTVKQTSEAVAREMWNASKSLSKEEWESPSFDISICDKCKKKTMLKKPWGDKEALRCLDADCWQTKQDESKKQGVEEKERKLNAKYPDAIVVTYDDDSFERLNNTDYCREKNCNDFRKARYKGADWVMDICFCPDKDKYKACQAEAQQKRERERVEKEEAARAEIRGMVDAKLKVRSDRKTLVYIATIILENLNPLWNADTNVFQYVQEIAAGVELEDATEDNEETWIPEMLKRFSEEQLFRIIIEWPAICDGMKEGSIIEWYLKDTSSPDDEGKKHEEPAGRTCRVCGCTDFRIVVPSANTYLEWDIKWVEPDLCSSCVDVAQEDPVPAAPAARSYIDESGKEVFASDGIGGETFGTFWRSPSGGLHRVKSPAMPMVATREEAQKNLDAWAEKKGLKQFGSDQKELTVIVKEMLTRDDATEDWKSNLAILTADELLTCIEKETRPSARSKFYKEARRRKLSTKAEVS